MGAGRRQHRLRMGADGRTGFPDQAAAGKRLERKPLNQLPGLRVRIRRGRRQRIIAALGVLL